MKKYVWAANVRIEVIGNNTFIFDFVRRKVIKIPSRLFGIITDPESTNMTIQEKKAVYKLIDSFLKIEILLPDLRQIHLGKCQHTAIDIYNDMNLFENTEIKRVYIDLGKLYNKQTIEELIDKDMNLIGIVNRKIEDIQAAKLCKEIVTHINNWENINQNIFLNQKIYLEITNNLDQEVLLAIQSENRDNIILKLPLFVPIKEVPAGFNFIFSACFINKVQYVLDIDMLNKQQIDVLKNDLKTIKLGCKEGRDSVYIDYKNNIYLCYHDALMRLNPIVNLRRKNWRNEIRIALEKVNVYNFEKCMNCNVKFFCGNYCRSEIGYSNVSICNMIRSIVFDYTSYGVLNE